MSTPVSNATAYCTVTRFVDSFDVRTVGDLLSDNDVRLTPTQVANSTVLPELLMEASGWVESACFKSERYTPLDLASLTGNSAQMLAGMVAGIAMFFLWDRRPQRLATYALPAKAQMAMGMLEKLENGLAVFGILENMRAGNLPDPYFMQPADLKLRNSASVQSRRYLGSRGQYHVPGHGCDGNDRGCGGG